MTARSHTRSRRRARDRWRARRLLELRRLDRLGQLTDDRYRRLTSNLPSLKGTTP